MKITPAHWALLPFYTVMFAVVSLSIVIYLAPTQEARESIVYFFKVRVHKPLISTKDIVVAIVGQRENMRRAVATIGTKD